VSVSITANGSAIELPSVNNADDFWRRPRPRLGAMATWACRSCGGENQQGTRFCGHCGTPASPTAAPARETESLRRFVTDQVADRLLAAGGLPPEERRLVTALFADLSGFTVLADRLDSEQLLEVVDPVIAALSNVVGRYDGYVEKYAGDALLALFGAPVSHEDDPERALFVALEMHAELARVCSELPSDRRELTLHVGINSGHGIARILGSEARMDYAVLGDFVVLAQRLESAAPPGATYVSDSTYGLTQHRFEFEPVGELTLKGKSEAVLAWRLVRERPRSAGRTSPTRRLVGRKRELEAVSNALDELARKRGGALAVTGEAGVGKSRLTAEARRLAESAGLRWLQACCVSYGAGLPYRPYLELLREEAGARREDKPTDVADRLDVLCSPSPEARPAFARLLGVPGDLEVRDLEPEPFRRALHDAFAAWLGALAAEQPAVLAIEDVHWADPSSLALTGELAARDAVPLILYLIARPEASASLAEIAPAARRIELEPLDEAGVATLIEGMLGESPPGLAALVHERTGGNPFFVEEVVRALEETGALRHEAGRLRVRGDWTGDDVPATIEGVLSARIDLLPRSAAVALQTAAVIGRRVPIPPRTNAGDRLPASAPKDAPGAPQPRRRGRRALVWRRGRRRRSPREPPLSRGGRGQGRGVPPAGWPARTIALRERRGDRPP
jgi:class 3 adenylate cyclase